jgi:hypothetical protein
VVDSEVISVNRDISDHDATLINIQIPCLLKRSYMRKIPSKLVRIRLNDKPWFNSEIRKEIRTRNRLHKAPFLVGSLITFVRLISEIISNNLLFSRNKSTFKSPFMIMFDV